MRIGWTKPGSRLFEAGVDRGVLYVGDSPGVPWNGLSSVQKTNSGAKPQPRYVDGVKVSIQMRLEEFEGTIQAFSSPVEFDQCQGVRNIANGLKVRQQIRKQFSICYRTLVGDEISGLDLGYKVHIVYGLFAEPSDMDRKSLSDQTEPMMFSWNISSTPPIVNGLVPTSEFEFDSRDTPASLLTQLEDILYGTESTDPRLPSAGDLIFMFDSFDDLVYNAGSVYTPVFDIFNAGTTSTPVTRVIEGGAV